MTKRIKILGIRQVETSVKDVEKVPTLYSSMLVCDDLDSIRFRL